MNLFHDFSHGFRCISCGLTAREDAYYKMEHAGCSPTCDPVQIALMREKEFLRNNHSPRTRAFRAIAVTGPCGGTYADGYEEIEMGNLEDVGIHEEGLAESGPTKEEQITRLQHQLDEFSMENRRLRETIQEMSFQIAQEKETIRQLNQQVLLRKYDEENPPPPLKMDGPANQPATMSKEEWRELDEEITRPASERTRRFFEHSTGESFEVSLTLEEAQEAVAKDVARIGRGMREVVEKTTIGEGTNLRYGIDVPAVEPIAINCKAMPPEHTGSKYVRQCQDRFEPNKWFFIDVYNVIHAYGVKVAGVQHALKKLLCAGLRGKGDEMQDYMEARDALSRVIEMRQAEILKEAEESKP